MGRNTSRAAIRKRIWRETTDLLAERGNRIRMMLAIEYLPKAQFFRVLYQFVLMLVLLAGAGASLAGCGMLLAGVWRTKKQGKAMLCACLLCVPVIFCPDDRLYPVFERGHALRALALALPAWIAWPILQIRRRKRRAQR